MKLLRPRYQGPDYSLARDFPMPLLIGTNKGSKRRSRRHAKQRDHVRLYGVSQSGGGQ